jgi:phosphoribosylformylglycinamidine synthase
LDILGSYNVASKHWIIRQYDHEVQAASAVKPLVGACNDGPSDAAVLKPRFDSHRGLVVACGTNPHYGDLDPYHMAASAIDEAVRNCVAVGADPRRIAILDNFCWGRTDRPQTLGTLVRAALACHDLATMLQTPFISGKDSLHNEFRYTDARGAEKTIAIPPTLLISAVGQIADVRRCVTMDLKRPGNSLYLVGATGEHLGGSHFNLVHRLAAGQVPQVDGPTARRTFERVHQAIEQSLIRACHDLSEGGLAVAVAEMAVAGRCGAEIELDQVPTSETKPISSQWLDVVRLFSESNSRFLVEVEPSWEDRWRQLFADIPSARVGTVLAEPILRVASSRGTLIQLPLELLRRAWQAPLDWA